MIRYLSSTGGRKPKNEDFELYTQSFDIIEGFASDLGETTLIISGCEITDAGGGLVDISQGIVLYNNELLIFEGVSGFDENLLPFSFEKVSENINYRTFFDTVSKPTSVKNKCQYAVGGGGQISLSTKRLSDYLNIEDEKTDWVNVTAFDGDNEAYSDTTYFPLQFRKKDGRVEVFGAMIQNTGNGFILPVGFRPTRLIELDATNGFYEQISVDSSGAVFVAGGTIITSAILQFNFSFPLK